MGSSGLEPPTSRLSGARSNHLSYEPIFVAVFRSPLHPFGGDDGIRTHDPLLAGQVLSQLSYTPIRFYLWCGPSKLNNKNYRSSFLVNTCVLGSLLLEPLASTSFEILRFSIERR